MTSSSQKQGTFWPASCVVHCQQEENIYSSMWYIYQTKLHGWHLNPRCTLVTDRRNMSCSCANRLPALTRYLQWLGFSPTFSPVTNPENRENTNVCDERKEGVDLKRCGSYLEMLWSGIIVPTLVSKWCQSAEQCGRHFVTKFVLFAPPFDLEALSLFQQKLRHNLLLTG